MLPNSDVENNFLMFRMFIAHRLPIYHLYFCFVLIVSKFYYSMHTYIYLLVKLRDVNFYVTLIGLLSANAIYYYTCISSNNYYICS